MRSWDFIDIDDDDDCNDERTKVNPSAHGWTQPGHQTIDIFAGDDNDGNDEKTKMNPFGLHCGAMDCLVCAQFGQLQFWRFFWRSSSHELCNDYAFKVLIYSTVYFTMCSTVPVDQDIYIFGDVEHLHSVHLQTVFAHLCPCCTCNAAPANLVFAAHWK